MKEFVILGKLETKYNFTDYDNPSITVLSMNKHFDYNFLDNRIIWFDLHENPEIDYATYTKSNFPFEDCHKLVGGRRFCCTMSYMIAWCILQGADKISIYGAKYTDDGNPRRQRELHNVRELIMFAVGRGVEIEICPDDVNDLFPEHIPDDGADFDQ